MSRKLKPLDDALVQGATAALGKVLDGNAVEGEIQGVIGAISAMGALTMTRDEARRELARFIIGGKMDLKPLPDK